MINILEMLEKTALRYPDRIAFRDPEKEVTFFELENRAKEAGTLFLRGGMCRTLKAEDPVAFFMEKSTDSLCLMMGAVYAGAFYSFIDVRQPQERVSGVLSVLRPAVIITDRENMESAKKAAEEYDGDLEVVDINQFISRAEEEGIDETLLAKARGIFYDRMPLYVNFTSGSTGIPKGVAVSHASVIEFITVFTKTFGITSSDIIANQAPFDFDVSVKDIYTGLYTGATVVLIPRDYFTNPTVLMDYLYENRVTTLIWAVSAMCFVSIMNGLEYKTPHTIKRIMFSGEVMPVKQLNKWKRSLPDAVYINLYGPTEITCNCTYYILDREFEKEDLIPAGIPFENEKVFLLDEEDREVKASDRGKEGEICVSGSCLALGYYRDSKRTESVFTQNPLNDRYPERIYRTGDIGKYDENGLLIYVSRKDFQIKHMGQRIELGEIESVASALDGVSRACCIYDHKKKRILLFYTGEGEKDRIREGLLKRLPQFMMPARIEALEEFPLNKNGKIDRNSLLNLS